METPIDRPHLKTVLKRLLNGFNMPGLEPWLEQLEDPLDCTDLQERQAVCQRNLEKLQTQIALLQCYSQLSPEMAKQYVENRSHFDYEQWQQLEQIKDELNQYEAAVDQIAPSTDHGKQREGLKKKKRRIGSYRGWIPS